MPTATLHAMPRRGRSTGDPFDAERTRRLRRLVRRQSLKAAGMSALPVAGVDLFVNGRLLASTLEQINETYGLSPQQIAALPAPMRSRIDDLTREIGSYLIGRVVTQAAILRLATALGLRLGAQQAAKLAPVAGLAASAALSGWMFKRLCDRHIDHCRSLREAMPELPPPPSLLIGHDPDARPPRRLRPRWQRRDDDDSPTDVIPREPG